MESINKKIFVCLLPYPEKTAPGQRFRWEQWDKKLKKNNIFLKKIYLTDNFFFKLIKSNNFFFIFYFIYLYFLFFIKIILNLKYHNFIIFRNCTIVGPPIIEIFLKILKKNIIFDFDDAIYLGSENNDFLKSIVRCDWKIKILIKISDLVIVGNNYLKKYAKKYNSNVHVIPTTIEIKPINKKFNRILTVGWSGSPSTFFYIKKYFNLLKNLQKKYKFKILIIGSNHKEYKNNILFVPWNLKTEKFFLQKIDIGLMPLTNSKWSKGKCGLKILQYFSLGIPSIASPIGVNSEIIQNGKNGYLANNFKEWKLCLIKLLKNKKNLKKFSNNAFKKVKKNYSLNSVIPKLEKILMN